MVAARVTTQAASTLQDVPIANWRGAGAGLLSASIVPLHKLATLEKSLVRRVLGRLQKADRSQVSDMMKRLYGEW